MMLIHHNKESHMVAITALLVPIIVSGIIVFIISAIIHMATPWHKGDYPKLPNEDAVRDALRPLNIPPGDYWAPRASSNAEMKSPEFTEKMKRGPVFMISVWPNQPVSMGQSLVLWFLYTIIVGIFAAYVAGRALPAGADYLAVFRFAGVTAFIGYSLALMQQSIWYRRPWGITIKVMIDGLIYSLLTAGVFGWLWPR
jgi:hypothetical protein